MARLATTLSVLAVAGITGCATYYEPPPPGAVTTTSGTPVVSAGSSVPPVRRDTAPAIPPVSAAAPVVPAGTYRAGNGIVESIGLVTLPPAGSPASAAAGASVASAAPGPYRITLRMDDGTIQTLVQDTRAFLVGDRIRLNADGSLSRP
jgi:hypothetical protein